MRKRLLTSATPFRYCFDHVCLGAAIAYAANRWFLKPVLGPAVPFLHDHLNDVLCIPLFLPPVLYVNYLLGLRPRHRRPTAFEALFHLVVWSVCFEAVAPRIPNLFRTTADPLDVAAYALGALLAGLVWGSWRNARLPALRSTSPRAPQ